MRPARTCFARNARRDGFGEAANTDPFHGRRLSMLKHSIGIGDDPKTRLAVGGYPLPRQE